MTATRKSIFTLAIKGALCALTYVVGAILTGMLAMAVHFAIPDLSPAGVSRAAALRAFVFACGLLGLALTPLAYGLRGRRIPRGLALAFRLSAWASTP